MGNKGKIKSVIFDMNGVIIDDEHVHEIAFKDVLSSYGINLTHEEYLKYFAGKTDKDGFINIAEVYGVVLPVKKLLTEKAQIYLKTFPVNKRSYPGVIELIQNLAEHYTLALSSSSTRQEVNLILREFNLEHYFRVTVSADDISHGKPDPESYLKTAELLNIDPSECVVIEDSKSGVISAKAARMYCIGITTTHQKKDLKEADVVVNNFSQISTQLIADSN